MKKAILRSTARITLFSLVYQLVFPVCVKALTSGPSQPEIQSFEPVGTTEMVDMFTGDFTYNIPLLDIGGYPINIAYHSGIGIEQEASWVGLGWNINPGEINRAMRGIPDDFNGEEIEKELKIKEEETWRVGMGGSVSFEIMGWDAKKYGINLSLGVGSYIAYNNYKGMSVGVNTSATISVPYASTGINMGIGSQDGADVDLTAGLRVSETVSNNIGAGISVSGGTGFNSRSGMKDLSFGVGVNTTVATTKKMVHKANKEAATASIPGQSFGSVVPIGLQNYVPVVSNPGVLKSFQFQGRFGGEIFYSYPNIYLSIQKSTMSYESDGTRAGYGYMYAENAPDAGIMDFSRDNDGFYNRTMKNLPLASMTYDVYSISGQGTGGVFRPFRNDIGSVFDPEVKSPKTPNTSVKIEGGIGNLFEIGTDITLFENEANSGPWERLNFRGNEAGSLYEKLFFKQAGELTYNNQQLGSIYGEDPIYLKENMSKLRGKNIIDAGNLPAKYGNAHVYWNNSVIDRTTRSNLLSFLTAGEASIDEIGEYEKVRNFEKYGDRFSSNNFYDPDTVFEKDRYSDKADRLNAHQMSELTQTLGDGRRFVYGIPAVNHMTREVTMSVNGDGADINTGLVNVTGPLLDGGVGGIGREEFYSSTSTPAYAYSYLLTSVLSADYTDITGDGPTDDDLGNWVKFNYTLWEDDYRWRTPYESSKAQYNPGFWSDAEDDKGTVIVGSKEVWHVRSIESKNYVAEFYVSAREDGKGVTSSVLSDSSGYNTDLLLKNDATAASSYKLDSIALYNKHDRLLNNTSAVPIKTIIFKYKGPTEGLCKGIPNSSNQSNNGTKLTLEKIYTKYGSSHKSLLNPYVFTYSNYNSSKHRYSYANKDRWGNFKDNSKDADLTNYEFPYVVQDGQDLDADAAPYELTEIKLPSGGKINVEYESDDYSFVQNKRTMQMFKIVGVGNSDKKETRSVLYEDGNNVNDYVYFERVPDREDPNLSAWDNYLEGEEYLYYSFNMDITGTGKHDYVKGYARIADVGYCSGTGQDTTYGYVQLKKDRAGVKYPKLLHPATVYGINTAQYYLTHLIYPGYNTNGDAMAILQALLDAGDELLNIGKDPVVHFVEKKKIGKDIDISKSWIRLCRPGLTKKGGGIRVRQLTLNDSWSDISSNANAQYGKTYEYTTIDDKYGEISSGVASYEPLVGGDENPFKKPVPYVTDADRKLPAKKFFQEEPFGESFFPPPVVGYSKVRVKSIHINEGRSSQSMEEHVFNTAKDYPIEVDYTAIDAPKPKTSKGLRKKSEEIKAYQGYVLRLNDMHGKPYSITNYVIRTDGSNNSLDKVSSVKYNYHKSDGKLDNNVTALYRKRGTKNDYEIGSIKLGEEVDFTVDTRERYNRSYRVNVDINLNVVLFGPIPIPIPTAFFPDKEETQTFRSMVSTKIIQKYGILESVETFDHGATTKVENLVYDAETGGVLLTRTNNAYNDDIYDMKYPAYWAYEGMGPAYANIGYEEKADSFVIEDRGWPSVSCADTPTFHGRLYVDKYNFYPGDELLLTYANAGTTYQVKAWVLDEFDELNLCPDPPYAYSQPYTGSGQSLHRRVVLRALRDDSGNELWPGIEEGETVDTVTVKVIRSGRRNMLDRTAQQVKMMADPRATGSAVDNILNANTSAFDKVLETKVWEYSDRSTPFGSPHGDSVAYIDNYGLGDYDHEIFPTNIPTAEKKDYNRYVLGHRGNYRQIAEHVFIDERSYASDNVSQDGTFSTKSYPFWEKKAVSSTDKRVLSKKMNLIPYWKRTSYITKYDVFGNAIEEYDATGKYVSAQYGYNKSLPVAVTSNAKQRSSSFDGFEEYNMLVPEHLFGLYEGTYYFHSPFAKVYHDVGQVVDNGYGQSYYHGLNKVYDGDTITSVTSHTGSYSLRLSTDRIFEILSRHPETEVTGQGGLSYNIKDFAVDSLRQYTVSMWIKPVSGTPESIASSIAYDITVNCLTAPAMLNTTYPFELKSQNIDGWYLISAQLDFRNNEPCSFWLTLPDDTYYDDIRFVPVGAQMKSFVYDPVTFKLIAELDENNFATFYEYDQEGLLVRVKKETDNGIVTISESRRANRKAN